MWNDPDKNRAINEILISQRERAAKQPISYKPLFEEAHDMATDQFMRSMNAEAAAFKLGEAMTTIAGFRRVNLAGEWEHGLRDIIRSIIDCAEQALKS